MAEQASAKLNIDAVGGVGKDVGPQNPEDRFEHRYDHETDGEHVERAETTMHQNLVDDDLEEQGGDQGKELQEERSYQDPGEYLAVLVNGANKPGDIEAAGQIEQPNPARQEHQLAIPDPYELRARH